MADLRSSRFIRALPDRRPKGSEEAQSLSGAVLEAAVSGITDQAAERVEAQLGGYGLNRSGGLVKV